MLNDLVLLAQAADSTQFKFLGLLAVLLLGIGLPLFLGQFIARRLRMADHGWRIGVVLCTVVLSTLIVGRAYDPETGELNIKLGVDLKGGVILIYEVDESATAAAADMDSEGGSSGRVNMGALVEAIARRINPSGTKEIVIRPYGDQQVEVIVPEVDQREVDLIKKSISTAGVLQFRIVANSRDHVHIIELAREAAEDPALRRGRYVRDESGEQVGLWARVGREQQEGGGGTFKLSVAGNTIRDASTGEILEVADYRGESEADFTRYIKGRGIKDIDVLMATDDPYNVTGNHLGAVSRGNDERLRPCIMFNLKQSSGGVGRFADLTTEYGPEGNFNRQLGIILDNTLLSAPNIQEPITQGRGRITGEFTADEVDFMVNILEAGSLPVVLNPVPISENQINPLLGKETIQQGKMAMGISLGLVLVFILIYYRFSGLVACVALLLNLLFILAIMILIKGAFTLPGLAGLVLTVGMSVDANVLIFERIREELSRGAALRMAIRNGFSRATTTIIDANVTTLITAFVLYGIGTDQIRGFAVTLILGILMSMYTAIFCSRVVFDIAERARLVKKLNMMQILQATQINFIGMQKLAATCSIIVIGLGLTGIVARGAGIFDIDFRGGTSVQMQLKESTETELVRERLTAQFATTSNQFSVTAMNNTAGETVNDTFKVDSDVDEVRDLEQAIHDAFVRADGTSDLATYSLEYGPLRQVALAVPRSSESTSSDDASPQTDSADPKAPAATEDASSSETPAASATPASSETPAPAETPAPGASEPTPAAGDEPESPAEPAKSDATEESTAPAADKASGEAPAASTPAPAEPPAESPAATPESSTPETASDADQSSVVAPRAGDLLAYADEVRELLLAQADTEPASPADSEATDAPAETPADETPTAENPTAETPADSSSEAASAASQPTENTEPAASESESPASDVPPVAAAAAANAPSPAASTQTKVDLTFGYPINAQTLVGEIDLAITELNLPISYRDVDNPEWVRDSSNAFTSWTLTISADEAQTKQLLDHLQDKFADSPVWSSSSKIGGQVAGDMQQKAIAALVASLFGIVVYIWIRFQHVIFGVAAVIALIHDVLITLGAIAVSTWLANVMGFLLIEEFKISLPIVAALLTIIGYSLNDTIVIFDRIREVRGKSPNLTADMINLSINQTLSRTLLTSLTTLIVVAILYAIGGEGIHGFAFSLVVGVIAGTYSTVFVASPVLLWMVSANQKKPTGKASTAAGNVSASA